MQALYPQAEGSLCTVILPENEPRRTPHPASPGGRARVEVYDLRDPHAWEQASADRCAWGRERTKIHTLDRDHVAIEFKSCGALEAAS